MKKGKRKEDLRGFKIILGECESIDDKIKKKRKKVLKSSEVIGEHKSTTDFKIILGECESIDDIKKKRKKELKSNEVIGEPKSMTDFKIILGECESIDDKIKKKRKKELKSNEVIEERKSMTDFKIILGECESIDDKIKKKRKKELKSNEVIGEHKSTTDFKIILGECESIDDIKKNREKELKSSEVIGEHKPMTDFKIILGECESTDDKIKKKRKKELKSNEVIGEPKSMNDFKIILGECESIDDKIKKKRKKELKSNEVIEERKSMTDFKIILGECESIDDKIKKKRKKELKSNEVIGEHKSTTDFKIILGECESIDDIKKNREKELKSSEVIGEHKPMTGTVSDKTSDSTADSQIANKTKREELVKGNEEVDKSNIILTLKDEKSDCIIPNKMTTKRKESDNEWNVSLKPSTLNDEQVDSIADDEVTNQEKRTDSLKCDYVNMSHTNPNTSRLEDKIPGVAVSKNSERCLNIHAGFAWGTTLDQLPLALKQNVDSRSSDDDDVNDDDKAISKKKKRLLTAAEKRESARQDEERIRKTEERLLDAERNPLSCDDFDRLVMSNPNSSRNWIKYMAYHLQATEIVKARTVAQRALNTISFREEQEKFNVWMALLNLENLYGTKESFEKTFHEALKMNDAQKVYFQTLTMFSASEKITELDKLVPLVTKKYKHNKDAWILAGSAYIYCGKLEKSRELMQKALTVLEKKYHIDVLIKFALLENELGSQNRADTIFDNILTSYPKRCDVWCVYVDMLVKSKNFDHARQVLDRAVIQKLPISKMKVLFKKYMKFEQDHGTPEGIEKVREVALTYLKSK